MHFFRLLLLISASPAFIQCKLWLRHFSMNWKRPHMQLKMIASVKTVAYATKIRLHKNIHICKNYCLHMHRCDEIQDVCIWYYTLSSMGSTSMYILHFLTFFLYLFLRASAQKSDWCSEANCRRMGHMYNIHTYTRKDEQRYL